MPRAFGDDERVAGEDDRDVMVPARKATTFVVVESELSLQVLISAFGTPALHDLADQLLAGHPLWQCAEEVVRWLRFAVAPFDEEPERFTLFQVALAAV